MAWKIELTKEVAKRIRKLDKPVAKRLIQFLHERVSTLNNPRDIGEALTGSKLGEFWKYRVGDYRIICKIEDKEITILVLQIGHRKSIYNND